MPFLLRLGVLAALCACAQGFALAGHDSIEVDPALKRYAGQITALGAPDAKGEIYSFRAKRIRAETEFAPDELRDVVRRGQNATSPTFAKSCGYTPTTTTTSALSPIATASGCGIWIGERSSATTGWNHICTITRK